MATLSHLQIQQFCAITGAENSGIELRLPATYVGPVSAVAPLLHVRSCSNWALTASTLANPNDPNSAEMLYDFDPVSPWDDSVRPAMPALNPPDPLVAAAWLAAAQPGASDLDKTRFMERMGRYAATLHHLTPVDVVTPYQLHVTAKRNQWFSWDHWGLSITSHARTIFIQVEAGGPMTWGYDRLWEANRPNNISASFYLQEIHQAHKDVIEVFLMLPMCRLCHRVKPASTSFGSRWHQCGGPAGHIYCGTCATNILQWNGVMSRTRRCNAAPCNAGTTLMGDP